MKVLLLITKSNMGGAQRYVYDIATNLPKDIYEVEVMAGGNGPLIESLQSAGIKASGNLPVGRDINLIQDIKSFFELFKIIREKKPDVLHVNSSKIGGIGAFIGRLLGIKNIIFTAHGFAFNEDRSRLSKLIIKFFHWLTIFLSHKTILVSEALKYQIADWPYIEGKLYVIRNGLDSKAVYSKINARYELGKINKDFDKIIKENKNTIIIGSVGELHHIKGYEYAIRAISNLIKDIRKSSPDKKIIYTIFGEGEDRINIEKEIHYQELKDSVILFGNIKDAFQYMKAFDIYLMPSISEGLPYALLEAGIVGLPVVASAVGGIPEVVEDMKTGVLIQSKKPKEIQHALEFYISHKKIQGDHAKLLMTNIQNNFSISKMLENTIKVYNTKHQ